MRIICTGCGGSGLVASPWGGHNPYPVECGHCRGKGYREAPDILSRMPALERTSADSPGFLLTLLAVSAFAASFSNVLFLRSFLHELAGGAVLAWGLMLLLAYALTYVIGALSGRYGKLVIVGWVLSSAGLRYLVSLGA